MGRVAKQAAVGVDAGATLLKLVLRAADGSGSERTITSMGRGFRYHIFWAPDSTKVAFVDASMVISYCTVATGKVTRVDQGLYMFEGGLEGVAASWSVDSGWLACSRA